MSGQPADKLLAEDTPSSEETRIVREVSPARNARSISAIPQLSRSRKNSQEFSPTRNTPFGGSLSTVPSAAAVQRALSAQRPIGPPGNVDGVLEGMRPERTMRSGHNSPSWPTSPRLKSPPPSSVASRGAQSKKPEAETTPSNTSSKRLATVPAPETDAAMQVAESSKEQIATQTSLRVPGRGPSAQAGGLETVTESSVPTTPSIGPVTNPMDSRFEVSSLEHRSDATSETSTIKDGEGSGDAAPKPASEKPDASKRSRATSTSRPPANLARRSFTSLVGSKSKSSVEPPRTMTVETEPVTSMSQLLPDRGVSGRDGTSSVRTKPSSETIRPKKEKKKSSRKAPSLTAGSGTSKADIFEAKVASAVGEADSTDSDETFVYESNPPESRPDRHHSRTPSATSLASQDQHGGRNKHGVRSGSHAIAGKKSMKFHSKSGNGMYNNHLDDAAGGDSRGSTRTASTPRHHHIGRYGRAGHASIFDADSPFTQANKPNSPLSTVGNAARLSRPNSPRVSNGRLPSSPRKADSAAFDVYEDVADDERTPLMGSVRVNRTRHGRRPNGSAFRPVEYADLSERNSCGRYGGCIILSMVIVLICIGIATFVVGLSQPLTEVSIKHIQNILASEQEIMVDLHVEAVNTNLFAITVSDLDINMFAESSYVGSADDWRKQHRSLRWAGQQRQASMARRSFPFPFPPFRSDDGVDEGTDPEDPESGTQKMLLGQIFEFDSPLTFEAAPIRRSKSSSVGEIRLAKPGNRTEEGGSARWERVLQHQFDLIVRGVIKYQLPLSSKVRSAKIVSRAKVYPDDGDGSGTVGTRQGMS